MLSGKKGARCTILVENKTIINELSADGLDEALREGEKVGLEVIPGIELSTLDDGREVLILGYHIGHKCERLQVKLDLMIKARTNRAVEMVKKLNQMGFDISL